MYCSGCGQALNPGQAICPQCGKPLTPIAPPIPGIEYQLQNYDSRIQTLSIFWFVYAGFALLSGLVGMSFLHGFMGGHLGPWTHGPWGMGGIPNFPFGPALLGFAWVAILVRVALAVAAGWGLMERTQWGRIVAIVAAFLCLLKFPFGTALGIYTLVTLLGYRKSTLYDQL